MALRGTIKDFGLGDIFQLIGIQRKTGVLTLTRHKDQVVVTFLEGQVVGADTRSQSVEDLLGQVLVRTGRITETQLREALRGQKATLQRLGHLLVERGFISEDDLVDALRVQSLQIVYRLFRWRDGTYSFKTSEGVDYDQRHFEPISAETILMEGARMIDEWPIIERKIRSDRMVLRRTEAADAFDADERSLVGAGDGLDLEFGFGEPPGATEPGGAGGGPAGISLSAEETQVLRLVDGRRTVEEVNDLSGLGEFDTYRILADLMTRNLVEEIRRPTATDVSVVKPRAVGAAAQVALVATILAAATVSLATLPANRMAPWRVAGSSSGDAGLRLHASVQRLERIEGAIEVYYLDAGTYPDGLGELVDGGYLAPDALLDPWGRPYGYRLSAGGYQLAGTDAAGEPSAELTVSRAFGALGGMMTDPGTEMP